MKHSQLRRLQPICNSGLPAEVPDLHSGILILWSAMQVPAEGIGSGLNFRSASGSEPHPRPFFRFHKRFLQHHRQRVFPGSDRTAPEYRNGLYFMNILHFLNGFQSV